MAWDRLREVSGGAGGGTAGDVSLPKQAGHLKYFVQVLAQSHTLRLCGGFPQKLFPAGQISGVAIVATTRCQSGETAQHACLSRLRRALTAPVANKHSLSFQHRYDANAMPKCSQGFKGSNCSLYCYMPNQVLPEEKMKW